MEIDWIDFVLKLLLGALTIFIYAVWKVRDHISTFDINKFVGDNKAFWTWALLMLILLHFVVTIEPTAAEAIKNLMGLDISAARASYILLGFGLAGAANGFTEVIHKNPIGTKKKE